MYICVQAMPEVPQPEEIMVPLLPYQRQFLAWAITQEQSTVRGGILADEMGMGKTLQVWASRACVPKGLETCALLPGPAPADAPSTESDDTLSQCMQAISVIVTHRTDDMRKLPPILPDAASGARRTDGGAPARPRLAMRGALSKGHNPVPVSGPVPMDSSATAPIAGPSLSTMAAEAPAVRPEEGLSQTHPAHHAMTCKADY